MNDTGSHRFTGPRKFDPGRGRGSVPVHPLGRIFFIVESGGGALSALATG